MSHTIGFEVVLATIAVLAEDAERALGDDNCHGDIEAAHLCGRISGILEVLQLISNLQDPSRAWAAGLVAAEHKATVTKMLQHAAEQAELRETAKKVLDALNASGRGRHGHYN